MKIYISIILLTMIFTIPVSVANPTTLSVVIETTPEAAKIGPDSSFVKTRINVVDASGKPVPNIYLKFHLDAPRKNQLISTDFPIVESTRLMAYEGVLPEGTYEFEYIYPIRGTYGFFVEAGMNKSDISIKNKLNFSISENAGEKVNFIIFISLLLVLGIVTGVIAGKSRRSTSAAAIMLIAASLLFGPSGSDAYAQSHGNVKESNKKSTAAVSSDNNFNLSFSMSPDSGRVGEMNTLLFKATDHNGNLIPETRFALKLWHIEDGKPVFRTAFFAPTGETSFIFQFFDGAKHEVRLEAVNSVGKAVLMKVVEVEGIDPPMGVKVKTIFLLVFVVFIGSLIGLKIQSSRLKVQAA